MEFLSNLSVVENVSIVGILILVAVAVITDKLVWHTRLKKEEARADRWERVALEALSAGARAGVSAAETTVDLVTSLPESNEE